MVVAPDANLPLRLITPDQRLYTLSSNGNWPRTSSKVLAATFVALTTCRPQVSRSGSLHSLLGARAAREQRQRHGGGVLDAWLDLVHGGGCVGCAAPGRSLCRGCAGALPASGRSVRPTPCPPGLAACFAAGEYDDLLRAMVLAHKEHGAFALAAPLGGCSQRPRRPCPVDRRRPCSCRCRHGGGRARPRARPDAPDRAGPRRGCCGGKVARAGARLLEVRGPVATRPDSTPANVRPTSPAGWPLVPRAPGPSRGPASRVPSCCVTTCSPPAPPPARPSVRSRTSASGSGRSVTVAATRSGCRRECTAGRALPVSAGRLTSAHGEHPGPRFHGGPGQAVRSPHLASRSCRPRARAARTGVARGGSASWTGVSDNQIVTQLDRTSTGGLWWMSSSAAGTARCRIGSGSTSRRSSPGWRSTTTGSSGWSAPREGGPTAGTGGTVRVELTAKSEGPVVRAEAAAEDKMAALDLALDKMAAQMRRAADRKKVHRGRRKPESLGEAMAAHGQPGPSRRRPSTSPSARSAPSR